MSWNMMKSVLLLLPMASSAFTAPTILTPRIGARSAVHWSRMMADELQTWFETKTGIAPKFMGPIMQTCDSEMIGSVQNLALLNEAGMLETIFKPVVAASIKAALSKSGAAATLSGSAAATATSTVPIAEVKRLLMKEGQSTWGSEAELRRRYDMFFHQDRLEIAQWNPSAAGWAAAAPLVNPNTGVPSSAGPFAVPAQPAGFVGGQWMPTAGGPAVAAAPAPAPAPVAAAPAAPPAPAAPAANKGTFTVTLINPDGTQKFECPPNLSVLDAIDELGNAADFAGLPYACRAGSCSACTGKLIKGTMDLSGCGFLSAEQKAKGFVLTCAAKPTSDCTIETHKEEDLF